MQEILHVPQSEDFEKCSSGSRILRSQFFPGLIAFVQICTNLELELVSSVHSGQMVLVPNAQLPGTLPWTVCTGVHRNLNPAAVIVCGPLDHPIIHTS
jgi:hypothetical protein